MEKNIAVNAQGISRIDRTKRAMPALTAAYSIGKRKYIVVPHYKGTGKATLENILMKLIKSDITKH